MNLHDFGQEYEINTDLNDVLYSLTLTNDTPTLNKESESVEWTELQKSQLIAHLSHAQEQIKENERGWV